MKLTPIALFTYNRFRHTRQTVEALQKNVLAEESEIIIFSDGPRSAKDEEDVFSVRGYLKKINGFRKVSIVERDGNLGLASSIIAGVSEIVKDYGCVIVLEDDLVTSPHFLKFMNDALERYKDVERVVSAHGYVYPVSTTLPETFFLRGADCWGWATWKRGWDLFEPDGAKLLGELRKRGLGRYFDLNGTYPYTKMLEEQTKRKNDSWAIRWYASAFLQGKLTLYPGRSLIKNIGADASGTHLGKTNIYDTEVSRNQVTVAEIPVEENLLARREIESYLRKVNPGFAARLTSEIVRFFK